MHDALVRGVRTFLAGLAGVATAALAVDWATDYKVGVAVVGVGVLAALVAAAAAFFLALGDKTASSPLGKALVQFAQMVGGGLAAIVITSGADLAPAGKTITSLAITATLSALATFFLNASEKEAVV